MSNILNWPHWEVIRVEEVGPDYRIVARPLTPPTACIFCGTIGQLRPYGARAQRFMDLPVHAKRTGILVERRRFDCQACGKTFIEPLADMDEKHRMTKRLLQFVRAEGFRRTFTDVADRCGLDEKTVRSIFKEYTAGLAKTHTFVTPTILGIDELHLIGKPRCVLTNVEYRTIVDLLEKRDQKTVETYLSKMPEKKNVQVVTMDMWRPYRLAVQSAMPDATVVVDKFHIVRMANQALEQVRKDLRASLTDKKRRTLKKDRFILLHRRRDLDDRDLFILDTWTKNFPQLGQAYELKEAFFEIWDETDRQVAWDKYTRWKAGIPADLAKSFKEITTAVENWKGPIFNYFDTPYTNAYTEALNGVMKVVNRNGRGYSFEVIRAKMLYLEEHMYRKRPYRESWPVEKPAVELPAAETSKWHVEEVFTFTMTTEQVQKFSEWLENMGVPLSTFEAESKDIPDDDDSTTKSE